MECLEGSGAVRPLNWSLGVKWLKREKKIKKTQNKYYPPIYVWVSPMVSFPQVCLTL